MQNRPKFVSTAMAWNVSPLIATVLVGQAATEAGEAPPPQDYVALFFEAYHGKYILGGIALLGVVWVITSIVGGASKLSAHGASLDRSSRMQLRKLEDAGNWNAVGDFLLGSDLAEEAADCYVKAQSWMRAGEAYERANNTAKAVQMYRKGGAAERAADLYARKKQYQLAGREFMQAEAFDKAGQMFLKGQAYREAADAFLRARNLEKAAEAFDKAGERAKAAETWREDFERKYDLARGNLPSIKDAVENAKKAAIWFADNDRARDAAALLRKAGLVREAAQMMARTGDAEGAAALLAEAGLNKDAARLYERIGDESRSLVLQAEARLRDGDPGGAGDLFAQAGDFVRAAEAFNEASDYARAAEMYLQAGDMRAAADLYIFLGDRKAAAETLERGGDFDQAGELFRALGDVRSEIRCAKNGNNYFRVGEILLEHGRKDEALAAFQRIEALDPRFDRANRAQADILRELGRWDVALSKYEALVQGQRPDKKNVEVYYYMARCAEEAGDFARALVLFREVLSVDYYFQDTQDRAADMQKKAAVQGQGPDAAAAAAARRAATIGPAAATEGRYQIIDEIARGGMGIVYRARDTVLDRVVAYKVLSADLKGNDVAIKYFLREARSAARMSHPNIVTVFDAGEQGGELFMAMELVEGQTLKQLVVARGPFPEKLARYVMAQAARGLAYAHDKQLVHRDIKPGNMMLTKDRTLKIMDFGLAKFVEEVQAQHTRSIGTPYYMSPEQIKGHELDGRSDIYSLGVSIFECATGQVPFAKGDLAYHHINTPAPRADEVNTEVSREFADIIHRCMAKNPDERYATAEELIAALR